MTNRSPRPVAQKLPSSLDLERRSSQLASLSLLLFGQGHDAFNGLFPRDRDNILWLVSDLACEITGMVSGGVE